MKYGIRVELLEFGAHWHGQVQDLDETELEMAVEGLRELVNSGGALSLTNDAGDVYIFPPGLLGKCVIALVKESND